MKIAIDAMGGDHAPEEIVRGAVEAAQKYSCEIVLVGDEDRIKEFLSQPSEKISILHAPDVIEMGEHPSEAVRSKKNSSIVIATELVKNGECDAVLSAGSTGAAAAAAQLILRRIHGIGRPAIATPLPTPRGVTLMLDSGGSVDIKPEHLSQIGMMAAIYAEHVLGKKNPTVGLLNIGEEETKGNEQVKATYQLLKTSAKFNFAGNVEGRDIPDGKVDVVLCDGFVGNVVLKFAEGLAAMIMNLIREAIDEGGMAAKLGALMLAPTLKKLGKRLDASEYGGAPLLGVNGCCVISHGSSNAKAICSAIGAANEYVDSNVLGHIKNALEKQTVDN